MLRVVTVVGIDPGTASTGWGAVEVAGGRPVYLEHGAIRTPPTSPLPLRLEAVHDGARRAIQRFRPDIVAVEEIFFTRNTKTAIAVAQARGVVLLAAAEHGVEVAEFTPTQVKTAVVGYGSATKEQVAEMVARLLGLRAIPQPDDAADALALALAATCGARRTVSVTKVTS